MNPVVLVLLALLGWIMLAGTLLLLIYAAGKSRLHPRDDRHQRA